MRFVRASIVAALVSAVGVVGVAVDPATTTHASAIASGEYVVTLDAGTNVAAKVRKERALGNPVSKQFTSAVDGFVATLDAGDVARLRRDGDVVAVEPNAPIRVATSSSAVAGRYVVRLRTGVAAARFAVASGAADVTVFDYVFNGFAASLTSAQLTELRADVNVSTIEPDELVSVTADQTNATWGLDRIDQRSLPLDRRFVTTSNGRGVVAYVVDTGIRATHNEFVGRVADGFDGVLDGNGTDDCHGHGTHVAGTIGGSTYGVAKAVTLVPVRVLGCAGSGYMSAVIAGIDWIIANHAAGVPAVANLSLGGVKSNLLNDAVARGVADGVTFVVAAGNANADACNGSPSSEPSAVTVGATTPADARASYSNWGSCVDLFAPGSSITSAFATGDTATATLSGTSMAAPHVAGAAALLLETTPSLTPSEVTDRLVSGATTGVVSSAGAGSPNLLVYAGVGAVSSPTSSTNPSTSTTSLPPTTDAPSTTAPLAPSNDAFSAAASLSGNTGSVDASTTYATREVGEPTHGGWGGAASIWFRWVAPADGDFVVSTGSTSDAAMNSSFDTLLGIYTGNQVNGLTSQQTNDDFSWPTYSWSRISMSVTKGTEYSIAVDGYAGARGAVKLSWAFSAVDLTIRPSAPRSVSVTALDSGAYVSWQAPLTVGRGTLIYTATASPGGQSCTVTATRCLIGGMVNGTAYSIVVSAKNDAGAGPESDPPVVVTPNSEWGRANPTRAWGVDRIDQRALPLNGTVSRQASGRLVTAYVIDTGVYAAHNEFTLRVAQGRNTIEGAPDPTDTNDCNGHGTHVAGTIAGRTLGVAPDATIIPVKVLDCMGSGSLAGVLAGIDWMVAHHQAGVPAVANMSLGGGQSVALNAAVARAVDDGITMVVAAGNANDDACGVSPASEPLAITVGATDRTDARASYSNWGSCVDVFAPGSGILSAGISGPTAEATLSGTSMASPHVAGAAALILESDPGLSPADVARRLTSAATRGVVTDPGTNSPNRLLFIGVNDNPPDTTAPAPTTSSTTTIVEPRREEALPSTTVPTTLPITEPTPSEPVATPPTSTPPAPVVNQVHPNALTAASTSQPTARIIPVSLNRVLVQILNFAGKVELSANGKVLVRTTKRVFNVTSKGIAAKRIIVRAVGR